MSKVPHRDIGPTLYKIRNFLLGVSVAKHIGSMQRNISDEIIFRLAVAHECAAL